MRTVPSPSPPPASIGTQYEIEGYEVQPNQKKETAKIGAPTKAISRRFSGGTGSGAYSFMKRS